MQSRIRFADPGGRSALRAASKRNPRNLPCPTCREPNRLTPAIAPQAISATHAPTDANKDFETMRKQLRFWDCRRNASQS